MKHAILRNWLTTLPAALVAGLMAWQAVETSSLRDGLMAFGIAALGVFARQYNVSSEESGRE